MKVTANFLNVGYFISMNDYCLNYENANSSVGGPIEPRICKLSLLIFLPLRFEH